MAQAHPRATQIGVVSGASSGVSVATSRAMQGPCPVRSNRVPTALVSPTYLASVFLSSSPRQSPGHHLSFAIQNIFLVSYPVLFVITWFHVLSTGDVISSDHNTYTLRTRGQLAYNSLPQFPRTHMRPCKRGQCHRTILPRTSKMAATHR